MKSGPFRAGPRWYEACEERNGTHAADATPMSTLKLTDSVSLEMRATRRRFACFAARTNRLALYSVSVLGCELNLYVARAWSGSEAEEIAAVNLPAQDAPAPLPPPGGASIVPFRPRPAHASPTRSRAHSSRR